MSQQSIEIRNPDPILAFHVRKDTTRPWWRYLDIRGDAAYLIGNVCETCDALFCHIKNAELPIAPSDLAKQLGKGVKTVSGDMIEMMSAILPEGSYHVDILTVSPVRKVMPRRTYSIARRTEYCSPYDCWGRDYRFEDDTVLHELILPLVLLPRLKADRIKHYEAMLLEGSMPTALSLSVADVRAPGARFLEWKLSHFLLDGHHKMEAASRLRTEINLLSFFSMTESLAREEHIEKILGHRY